MIKEGGKNYDTQLYVKKRANLIFINSCFPTPLNLWLRYWGKFHNLQKTEWTKKNKKNKTRYDKWEISFTETERQKPLLLQ